MASDNEDDELLRRFAALRAPPGDSSMSPPPKAGAVSKQAVIDQQTRDAAAEDAELDAITDGRALPEVSALLPPIGDEDGNDIRRRLGQLKGEDVDEEDDGEMREDEVEAFLASLTAPPSLSDDQIKAPPSGNDIKLSREAAAVLSEAEPHLPGPEAQGEPEDLETEKEILARALAEAEMYQTPSPSRHSPSRSRSTRPKPSSTSDDEEDGAAAFPSIPDHLPAPKDEDEDDEPKRAVMSRLLGLSGPFQAPGAKLPSPPKREVGKGWNLPGYDDTRDEDLDSWCCICNKDAVLVCLGCDDDSYCRECWNEGHGEGGERGHRTRKLVWKRKKAMGA